MSDDDIKDTRKRIANLIRAELVCCDIYEKLSAPFRELSVNASQRDWVEAGQAHGRLRREARLDGSWHDICYFGEWSARLAENGALKEAVDDHR